MSQKLISLINKTARSRHVFNVFSDFVEMSALAISNSCDKRFYDEREAKYMMLINKYEKQDQQNFPAMLAELTMEMERNPRDILGEIYMAMGFGSKIVGQFFTPMSLSFVCAKITLNEVEETIKKKGFVTVNDCAIGGGAMPLAFALAFKEKGYNYQTQLHISGTDVDIKGVHMAYLQYSLMGIPAVIHHGNSLSLETYSEWKTPFHIMFGWDFKLRRARENSNIEPSISPAPAPCEESSNREILGNLIQDTPPVIEQGQIALF